MDSESEGMDLSIRHPVQKHHATSPRSYLVCKVSDMTFDSMFTFTSFTTGILDKKNYTDGEWEMTLKASNGEMLHACNYFGTKVSSLWDDNDEWDPIPLGDAVGVYLTRMDSQQRSVQLSTVYQSVSEDRHRWYMVVENRGGKPTIELHWERMKISRPVYGWYKWISTIIPWWI